MFTVKKMEIEKEQIEREICYILGPEMTVCVKEFTSGLRTRESQKCKERQAQKFETLKAKSDGGITIAPQENIKDRWVINHLIRTLNENENRVLNRGLKFAVTPRQLPIHEFVTATEQACNQLNHGMPVYHKPWNTIKQ